MGIAEKRVSERLSAFACIASILITGVLFAVGIREPEKYLTSMRVNNHQGYGSHVSCEQCHVPAGPFGLVKEMNCTSAMCHGELLEDYQTDEALQLAIRSGVYDNLRDVDERTTALKRYLQEHHFWAAGGDECWDCHREHSQHKPAKFKAHAREITMAERSAFYRSLLP